MSLPPGFLDELRTRASLAQVAGRKLTWDPRKSNQGKGDLWAPCPFHQEKTASFHVDDRQGFYYCFGCHAKGDAISFVRETENVGFMEAVEILAREVGMPMPARDPVAAQKADRRSELAEITEAAARFFRMSLNTQAGAQARAYLDGRGMSEATREKFEIGYAPAGNVLIGHLKQQGVSEQDAFDAGLMGKPDDGRAMYDFYRDRIMFPIRDARGRCISFGGRSMDPDARAKYLNGPETILFDKGHALYNHGPARASCGKGQPLIVAEGYMDVIALVEAGFEATVAPLGTAITEGQLQLLWRMSEEPVLALDGDKAGLRAAMRLIDMVMPMLESGQSLRFALLPEQQDPDELIKSQGPQAMQALLDGALPLIELLWRRETEGKTFDSPERRSALEKALNTAIEKIRDPGLKHYYQDAVKERRYQFFRAARQPSGQGAARTPWVPRKGQPLPAAATTKGSALAASGASIADHLREAVVLATLIRNPTVIEDFLGRLETLNMEDPMHARLLEAILRHSANGAETVRDGVASEYGEALEKLLALNHVRITPPVLRPNAERAALLLSEELAKLKARRGHGDELTEALIDIVAAGGDDHSLTWRLRHAAESLDKATRSEGEDKTVYDIAPSGVRMSREERNALDDLISKIPFDKGRKS